MNETGDHQRAAGWLHAEGDPPDTVRYWSGVAWQGEPHPVAKSAQPPVAASGSSTAHVSGSHLSTASDGSGGWSAKRKAVVIFLVGGVLLGLVSLLFFLNGNAAGERGDAFLSALQERDYEAAAGLIDRSCIAEDEIDASFLANQFRDVEIVDFTLETESIRFVNSDQIVELAGSLSIQNGFQLPVNLQLVKNGDWLICGILLGDG